MALPLGRDLAGRELLVATGSLLLNAAKTKPKSDEGSLAPRAKFGSSVWHKSRAAQDEAKKAGVEWRAALRSPKPACLVPRHACAHCSLSGICLLYTSDAADE